MHANIMSKIFGGDSSSSAIFENLDALNVGALEVNGINLILVILSDSFGSGEGSIESGDEPFRALIKGNVDGPSEKDEVMNSCSLDMRIVVFCLSSSIMAFMDLDVAITARNERKTHHFTNTYRVTHSWNPNYIEIKHHFNL